jgi:hypothetical protein
MKTITRTQAIHDLRAVLRTLVDNETSLCAAVARRGVFCRGFSRWSLAELRERYPWIDERHPAVDRTTFEAHANRWERCRQRVELGRLPCDIASRVSTPSCAASRCGWCPRRSSLGPRGGRAERPARCSPGLRTCRRQVGRRSAGR